MRKTIADTGGPLAGWKNAIADDRTGGGEKVLGRGTRTRPRPFTHIPAKLRIRFYE